LHSEKELLSLLVRDPDVGLEKIMDRYMALSYAIVKGALSGILKNQDIEECVSDVFYEVYRSRHQIDLKKGTLKAYIAVISKRRAIDLLRKHKSAETLPYGEPENDVPSEYNLEDEKIKNEASELLVKSIIELGEPDTQIIIRKFYFNQTSKEIGKALGIKENTINKRVARALEKLKNALGGII